MAAKANTEKLFVLCFDGLSNSQLDWLARRVPVLEELCGEACRKSIDTRPFSCPQPFWAELLSGRAWSELDCPGYARPANSLNQLEIMTENHLPCSLPLLCGDDQLADVLINLPLVKPKPGRFWLSDGSFPIQITCYPQELERAALFHAYKPRPFISTTAALADKSASVSASLQVEQQRLDCAIKLLAEKNWRTAFLRVSVFDLLAHLIEPDFLHSEQLSYWKDIDKFLSSFSTALAAIFEQIDLSRTVVFSSFSHVPCHSRLNLNLLLEKGGFCRLEEKSEDARLLASGTRADAVKLLNWAGDAPPNSRPMVSKTNSFDLRHTYAGSPVQGAVYLNRKDRFENGTVDGGEVLELRNKVATYLTEELQKELGQKVFLWHSERRNQEPMGPDLMVYATGVEIHNTAEGPIFDRSNRPRTTHAGEGFVLLPIRFASLPEKVGGLDLHNAMRDLML
jgi:hypothetical protein